MSLFLATDVRPLIVSRKYAADPSLRTLLNKISTLRMGCPVHLRRPAQIMNGSLDIDLLTATMITHAGLVSLAEPLITVDSWTHDISRMCLTAIRSILSILYDSELCFAGLYAVSR